MRFLYTLAQTIDTSKVNIPKVEAQTLIPNLLNTVYWIAGVAAVIVIVIAGIFYSISEGSPDKIKRAKDAIIYSAIGLVVILGAFMITNFVIGRF
jgi:multisubunit Na+/H+ antiporter MnhB subunit